MAMGEVFRDQGEDLIVVFDGTQSLLDDYSRPSTLYPAIIDPIDGHRNRPTGRRRRPETLAKAKRECAEYGR